MIALMRIIGHRLLGNNLCERGRASGAGTPRAARTERRVEVRRLSAVLGLFFVVMGTAATPRPADAKPKLQRISTIALANSTEKLILPSGISNGEAIPSFVMHPDKVECFGTDGELVKSISVGTTIPGARRREIKFNNNFSHFMAIDQPHFNVITKEEAAEDGSIGVYDRNCGLLWAVSKPGNGFYSLSPDGKVIVGFSNPEREYYKMPPSIYSERGKFNVEDAEKWPSNLAAEDSPVFSDDSSRIAITAKDFPSKTDWLILHDIQGKEIWRARATRPHRVRFSPDGRWLAYFSEVPSDRSILLNLADSNNGSLIWSRPGLKLCEFFPEGEKFVATAGPIVKIINTVDGATSWQWEAKGKVIIDATYHAARSKLLLSASVPKKDDRGRSRAGSEHLIFLDIPTKSSWETVLQAGTFQTTGYPLWRTKFLIATDGRHVAVTTKESVDLYEISP